MCGWGESTPLNLGKGSGLGSIVGKEACVALEKGHRDTSFPRLPAPDSSYVVPANVSAAGLDSATLPASFWSRGKKMCDTIHVCEYIAEALDLL